MSAQTPAKITLEEITQRKKKLLNEIQAQKRAMTATTREIFSPLAPTANKAWIRSCVRSIPAWPSLTE